MQANGGNVELFHVNLPGDRIFSGNAGSGRQFPEGLEWPVAELPANARIELFKVRNSNDVVVGVASRVSGPVLNSAPIVEWSLHLPARGTLYASLGPSVDGASSRRGVLRAGTREFAQLAGRVDESYSSAAGAGDASDSSEGRINLVTSLVGVRFESTGDGA